MSTRSQVKVRIGWIADSENYDGADATSVNELIQLAYRDAWNILLATHEDHALVVSANFTLSGGVSSISLTGLTGFLKLRGVQRLYGGRWGSPLPTFQFDEMGGANPLSYRIISNTVQFDPVEACAGTYRLWYIAEQTALTADGDTVVDPVGGALEEYIIATVGLKIRAKEETTTADMEKLRAEFAQKIKAFGSNRNESQPERISDVRMTSALRFRTRSGIPPYA